MAILQTATQFNEGDQLTAQMATDMLETAVTAHTDAQAAKIKADSAYSRAQLALHDAELALDKATAAYDLAAAIQSPQVSPTNVVNRVIKNDIY